MHANKYVYNINKILNADNYFLRIMIIFAQVFSIVFLSLLTTIE